MSAPLRLALIDIGSSSIRLIIGERRGDEIKILEHPRNALPIGLDTFRKGELSQEITNQTLIRLRRYQEIARGYDVTAVRAFATTAVREAANREMFIDTVERKTGLRIELLPPGDVVYYMSCFINLRLGPELPIRSRNILVAEFGAGTAEFSLLRQGRIVRSTGLPLGSQRLTRFLGQLGGAPTAAAALRDYISSEMRQLKLSLPKIGVDEIVLISEPLAYGLPAMLGPARFSGNLCSLTRSDARALARCCAGRSADDLAHEYRMSPDMAEATAMLSLVLEQLFSAFERDRVFVLEASLLEAILTQLLMEPGQSGEQDRRRQLVSLADSILRKYNADRVHAQQVVRLSRALFQGLQAYLGLSDQARDYLELAGYLHDIGKFISNSGHHRHSEYIITSLNLFRLSEREQKLIACLARHHRGAAPSEDYALYRSLTDKDRILVQKLSALLRMADALDRSHDRKVRELQVVKAEDAEVELQVSCRDEPVLERVAFDERKHLFESITGSSIRLQVTRNA
jgi:exopolyphosphatase/guanosine-5'-triphosphate,3'-diphosphate pyrophosphatase